ncbi:MAG: GNAT family N-acetyltransferase [Deltaproteobacteria bacterium]|nr:GNAT family N-acetyltransferase [Deltaproteobacteria bacterium]
MSNASAKTDNSVRPLRPADLERVIAIDSGHVGEPRRRFFEKRLAHAKQHPEDFVHVGVVRNGSLVGFAFARILRGEFGREKAIATLDAVSVEHDSRERGVGHALMASLTEIMRQKGVHSLQSQADWTNHALLRFFDAAGFGLAPRLVLERSVLTPLAEPVEDE